MPLAISKLQHELKGSPIRRIADLLGSGKIDHGLISFGGGAPSLKPPPAVVNAITSALKKDSFKAMSYTPTSGNLSLRAKICGDLKKSEKISVKPEQVALTTGATGAIFLAIEALVDAGKEVLIADPTYVGYSGPTIMDRATVKHIPTKWQENFQPSAELLKQQVTKNTAAIIILTPDNPTGRILSREITKTIADLAVDNDLWIISDETYKDIIYSGRHWPIYKFAPENTISVFSYSKSASSPALRLGHAYGPSDAIDAIVKLNEYVSLCPSNLSQIAAEAFYTVKKQYLRKTVIPAYRKKMECMGRELKEKLPLAGFVKPQGAFYYFADFSLYLRDLKINEEKLSERLLKEKKVVVIPGRYFGESGKNHCRLTFVSEPESRIREGVERIADFFNQACTKTLK